MSLDGLATDSPAGTQIITTVSANPRPHPPGVVFFPVAACGDPQPYSGIAPLVIQPRLFFTIS